MTLKKKIIKKTTKKDYKKTTVLLTYLINDLSGEEIVGAFLQKKKKERKMQKANQKEFRIEKLIKKKGTKLYVKRKGYNNLFDSWIDVKI